LKEDDLLEKEILKGYGGGKNWDFVKGNRIIRFSSEKAKIEKSPKQKKSF